MVPLLLPDALPPAVAVWCERLDLSREPADADWALLSDDERLRATRWRQRADRVRAVRGRAQLRRLLGERLDLAPRAVPLQRDAQGRPVAVMPRRTAPSFNVAHGGDALLIALDLRGGPVGVDVEPCCRADAATQALTPLLTEHERHCPMPALRRWVAKEAALKALGVGVPLHLQALSVTHRDDGPPRLAFDADADWPCAPEALQALRLWPLPIDPAHEAALCCAV